VDCLNYRGDLREPPAVETGGVHDEKVINIRLQSKLEKEGSKTLEVIFATSQGF
jgi:hypothetical protein